MIVATWFQRRYGVIKYVDFEFDIFKNIICIYCCFKPYKVNKFQNDRSNLLLEVVCGNRVC